MPFADWLPTLAFLIVFPLWLRLIGRFVCRGSGWEQLAKHYGSTDPGGGFETCFRLVVGGTKFLLSCRTRIDDTFLYLKPGGFARLVSFPGPLLRIPLKRVRRTGRNQGVISFPGGSVAFEGLDLRER